MKTRALNRLVYIVIAAVVAAGLLCFSAVFLSRSARGQGDAAVGTGAISSARIGDDPGAYEAKDFTAVPIEFEQIAGSDVSHTATAFFDGEMSIDHSATSVGPANYYGAAYKIAAGRTYGDFEFEMSFRAVSHQDTGRFIAVMFHTKQSGSRQIGYMVNYRIDGRNAMSALNAAPGANDENNNKSVALTDRRLHTLRLEVSGKNCRYYMDGVLLRDYDLTEQDGHLGGGIDRGEFALIVNRCRIMVKSIKINEPKADEPPQPTGVIDDDIIANTYYESTGLINAPAVVCDVMSGTVLESVTDSDVMPASVILDYGADGNATDDNGDPLGAFEDVYLGIRGRIVPIVRIESAAAADKFIQYMTEVRNILDISVASSSPAIVKRVRVALPSTRGIVFYNSVTSAGEIVKELNAARATVAVVPQKAATLDFVTAVQARFKTVWAVPDSYMLADIYDCVNSGAYGVVSPYFRDVYDALRAYKDGAIPRSAMNVAHRGCSNARYENSLSAVRLAVESGATHLELDGKLTTDGRIVIMHDDDLTATTTGTGNIETKSYAQLMEYDLTLRDSGGNTDVYMKDDGGNDIIEKIPSLEQVLDEIKNTDVVLVFEIKTNKLAIVDKLKEVLERYDMKDQVVTITFDKADMLDKMYATLSEVPVAWLEGLGGSPLSLDDFGYLLETLGRGNAAYDKSWSHGGATLALNRYLRDRGMVGWYWTFADEEAVRTGERMGYLGLTNNCAEIFEDRIRFVSGVEQSKIALAVGDTVTLAVTTYAGETTEANGVVSYCRRVSGGWRVVAEYATDRGVMYTQSFVVGGVSIA